MPHNLDLILTLTGGLSAALLFGLLTNMVRLSPIVGYLLAGVLVGPSTPGFVARLDIAEQLAEVGVILLMFGVGLHFHLRELLAVRRVAIPGALVQITVAASLGIIMARVVGWSLGAGLVFGLSVSVASTVVLLRMLADNNALHTRPGHIAVGWLVVEDIFTVFVLVLLPVILGRGAPATVEALGVGLVEATLKVAGLMLFTAFVGRSVIPKLLTHVAKTRSRELFTLSILVLALGISVGAAKVFGVSMALGAFLAGMVVGQSSFSSRAASDALPMRDAFAVLFFVSIGMLFDPTNMWENCWAILATVGIVVIAKPLAALLVVLLLKKPLRTGLLVAVALAQIGEFSFILAALGRQLNALPEAATQVLVAASIISITLNPLLFRAIGPLHRILLRLGPRRVAVEDVHATSKDDRPISLVIGYGPVGQTLTQLLRDHGVRPVIVELNHETVQSLLKQGIEAIYGDATQPEILVQAGVSNARSLIFAASGTEPSAVIRIAMELNPRLLVLARALFLSEAEPLRTAGAHVVVAAEAEVALAMAERLLLELGVTAEQLDRERDKVRAALAPATKTPTPAGSPS